MPVLGAETLDFECVDDVAVSSKKNQYLDDKLYAETIQYLRGFISILNTHNTACDSRAAMLKESRPLGEKSCLNQEEDVVQLIEQSQIILDNPEKFRACFDAQRDYKGKNKLYTPNALLQKASSVSTSINRPLLTEYYKPSLMIDNTVAEAGQAFGQDFIPMVSNVVDKPLKT